MADNQQYIDWAKANISGWDSLDTEKQNAVIQKRSAEVWAESNISNWAGVDKEKRDKIIQKRIGESGGNNESGDTGFKLQNVGLPSPIPTLGSISKDASFSSGLLSGLTAGLYEPKIPEEIGERSGYKTAGEIAGTLAPITGINKAVSGMRLLSKLPKFARLALQGGIAGGTLGTAKEVGGVTRGESFDAGNIGKEALAWSALEVGGGAIGSAFKKTKQILKNRQQQKFTNSVIKNIQTGNFGVKEATKPKTAIEMIDGRAVDINPNNIDNVINIHKKMKQQSPIISFDKAEGYGVNSDNIDMIADRVKSGQMKDATISANASSNYWAKNTKLTDKNIDYIANLIKTQKPEEVFIRSNNTINIPVNKNNVDNIIDLVNSNSFTQSKINIGNREIVITKDNVGKIIDRLNDIKNDKTTVYLNGKKMVVEDTNIDKIKDILVKDEIKSLSGTIKNRINNSIMKKDVDGVMSILKQNTLLQQEEIHKIAKQVRTGELTDPSLRLAANDTKVPSPNVVGQPHTSLDAPVVTRGEEAVLKSAKKLDPNSKLEALKNLYANPIWWTEETGTKEIILYPVREASHKMTLGQKAFEEEFKGIVKKRFSFGSRDVASERIGTYAIAQQKGGDAILKSMGKEVPTLNKAEVETYEHIRNNLELAHGNVNSARKMAGLPPIPKQENYFTFWRKLESELENGHTIESLRPGMFSKENILKAKESSFRFGKKRILDNYGEVSLDAFSIYQKYMNSAIKHKEFTPVIGKLRQMLDGKFNSGFKLKEDNPVLYNLINNYTNDLAGVRDIKLGKFLESGIDKINHNMTIAVLSYNVRSAMIQPTAIAASYIELGPKWVAMGIRDAAKPSMRRFAKETSETLLDREFDYSMMEAMKGLTGKIGAVKKGAAKVGMLPLKVLDGETAQITWLAGYQKATKALGMNKAQAKKYADDIVIQTQASGSLIDRPAVQRTALGRSINQYQTFVINNWNFLGRKVLGIKNPDMTKRQVITKLSRYIAASQATGVLFEDVLNVRSPLPDPVHSYINAKNRGEGTPKALLDAGLEFVELGPTFGGGIKYGSNILGAGAQTATDIGQIAAGKGTTEKSLETLGKILGVPGTVQAKKLVRYKKRKKMSYKK